MAQTFDIRFARSAGLAGLFERPANEFRWKGAGLLSIDASGVSIAVKRGLLSLFASAQSRRFAANSLVAVYREGNALRLEFSSRESLRTMLPIWVSNGEAAATIVTLLPTRRSVELEDGADSPRRYRFDRRLVAVLSIGVVMLGAGALVLQRYLAVDVDAPRVDAAALAPAQPQIEDHTASSASAVLSEIGPPTPAPRMPTVRAVPEERGRRYADPAQAARTGDLPVESEAATAELYPGADVDLSARAGSTVTGGTVVSAPVKSAQQIAVEQFVLFRAESNALHADYLYARDSLAYEQLEAIEARWLAVTARIVNTEEFAGAEFYALREKELAVSRNWRDHLSVLAAALRRGGDRGLMKLAAAHLAFAEAVEAQLSDVAP